MKKVLLSILTVVTFGLGAISVNAASAEAYYEEATSRYFIYTDNYSGDCLYAVSDTDAVTPTIDQVCDVDTFGNNIVIINAADKALAKYLWIRNAGDSTKNLDAALVDYTNALSSVDANLIDKTGERIPVTPGENELFVKTDGAYSNFKYILVKVQDNLVPYELFVQRAANTKMISNTISPVLAIGSMKAFYNSGASSYSSLVPAFGDSRWTDLPADRYVREPENTTKGDIYVVWLVKYNNAGDAVYDMQIMYCEEKEKVESGEYTDKRVKALPQTGINYALDALLIVNAAAVGTLFFKRKKLVNLINEK